MSHPAVDEFIGAVVRLGWVDDVWLSGSLAGDDHRPGVSDIDLVAVTQTVLTGDQLLELEQVHQHIDATVGRTAALGCTYVAEVDLHIRRATHPTWTHGVLVDRWLSSIARAELLSHGIALVGRDPRSMLTPMQPDEVSQAARDELEGYWSWAARRPWREPFGSHPCLPSTRGATPAARSPNTPHGRSHDEPRSDRMDR